MQDLRGGNQPKSSPSLSRRRPSDDLEAGPQEVDPLLEAPSTSSSASSSINSIPEAIAAALDSATGQPNYGTMSRPITPPVNGTIQTNVDVESAISSVNIRTGSELNKHHMVVTMADETLHLWGYKKSMLKVAFLWLATFATLGFIRLFLYWYPKWLVKCTAYKCPISVCDYVLVKDEHENEAFRPIRVMNPPKGQSQLVLPLGGGKFNYVESLRYFTYRKMTYIWHPNELKYTTIAALEADLPLGYFHECIESEAGLSDDEVQRRLIVYGKNLIEVKLKPILVLLFKEVLTPFYIFQVFSVTVWYTDNYAYYASIIIFMSVTSICADVYQIRKQELRLQSMVQSHEMVMVLRNGGQVETISQENLVPGDVLLIPPRGCILQCDAILMNGTVIVNESMLTGESVPITKVALPELDEEHESIPFSFKEHSKHLLFCGTQVLQTRYYRGKHVQAIVLRTAYTTLKGQLVRSIMYPKPVDFRFTKDLFKFVGFLACIAALGFAYTLVVMIVRGSALKKIIVRSLDIITIVVPPALPAAMSIGIIAAQMRLRAKQIFCISPSTINTCGAINTVCFDKTGTLTEDGLDFNCARAVFASGSDPNRKPEFGEEMEDFQSDELPRDGELVKAVATCHSLTRIDNELCGDPLDLILFRKTAWIIDETTPDNQVEETARFDMLQPTVLRSPVHHFGAESETELAVIRQFTFSSSLQRMAVIVHNPKEESRSMHIYVKGAPEMIASLCEPDTVPENFQEVVNEYAQHGYRLIAVASRNLKLSYVKAQKVKRELIECQLTMLGLIVMENRVKKQTVGVINQLNRAHIRTIMVTGDNLLTAMSVARECGIIRPNKKAFLLEATNNKSSTGKTLLSLRQSVSSSEEVLETDDSSWDAEAELGHLVQSSYHLAIAGPTFSVITHEYPELLDQLVCVCDVYARMSPDQKQQLINSLQEVDYTVAMCGDGANDCAALKAAHAGISLSEAEASIAAPFTSKINDIRCVPMVIREGRAALVTSFGVFKYMAGYSLTQFITIMQLYWLSTNLTDFQFLYIDLFLITLVALSFGYTPACEKLAKTPPPTRLLSVASVLSIIGQLTIIASFQLFSFIYTAYQPWFIPYAVPLSTEKEDRRSMQGTAIFCVSCFQYITLAIIYSKGYPYRKPLYSNIPMCVSLLLVGMLSIWVTLSPLELFCDFLEFDPIPYFGDRLFYFMLGILSGVLSYLYETFFIEHMILGVRERHLKHKQLMSGSGDINRFERILIKIGGEPSWLRAKLSHFASVQSQEDLKSNGTNSTPNGKAFPENGKITSTLHPENSMQHPEEDARLLNCDTPMTERSSAPLIYAHSDHSDVLDEIELSDTKSH